MSNRTRRVNVLLQREISAYLHSRYQSEAVRMTITEVRVSPDLREARVFYSVIGGPDMEADCGRWLRAKKSEIRQVVGKHVVLKNVPQLIFVFDASGERGSRVQQLLDEMGPDPSPSAD